MLTSGTRFGAYEIIEFVAAGGMGEVYRARDARLGRDVAIKVLSPAFAADADRIQRFEREARAAAALNHPHILSVFDIGQHENSPFIVSEVLEGETLREVLTAGPLPVRRVVEYAIQIARGLAAAHEKGIVHRDLKPENIFITRDHRVKILDFGLAKLTEREPAALGETIAPTVPPDTIPGLVLGTIGYMSPEQVRSSSIDARSDIFAFGAILYELLSGRRVFGGDTPADVMSAILKDHPAELPLVERRIPVGLQRIVDRCLEKHPSARFQSTRDLTFALEGLSSHSDAIVAPLALPRSGNRRERLAWGIAAAALAGMVIAAPFLIAHLRETSPTLPAIRFGVSPGNGVRFTGRVDPGMSVSPDGRFIVFQAQSDGSGVPRLWIRPSDALEARPIEGTDGGDAPFWSPDSRSIGFVSAGKLRRVEVAGGPVQPLTDVQGPFYGATWSRDGTILFAHVSGELKRISASGGQPIEVKKPEPGHVYRWPHFLDDGRAFVFYVQPLNEIRLGSIDSNETRRVIEADSKAMYGSGYLVFSRGNALMAHRFDPRTGETSGDPWTLAESIGVGPQGGAPFSLSNNAVVYRSIGGAVSRLVWRDRTGRIVGVLADPGSYEFVTLSPDGTRAAVSVLDRARNTRDIWLYDVARTGARTRFTFDADSESLALWSPDGARIVFNGGARLRTLYESPAGGTGSGRVFVEEGEFSKYPDSWSPDGRYFMYATGPETPTNTSNDIWVLPLSGDRKPFPFLNTPFSEFLALFSPDGKWVVYQSNETGRMEIYLTPFPDRTVKIPVSTGGGSFPRWRGDGKELFYLSADGKMMSVEIRTTGATYGIGEVKELFDARVRGAWPYDVTADGQRFLVNALAEDLEVAPISVIANWTSLMPK
jgi:serine/threonine protein kinase/Tol biopolymer transport system component